ncbi:MAG TPA: tetratricopeptide repeat protein [Methylomirabilota bacterium]|nr:tetratricopeptide repeat protein [Methylomirabilota bacterium]
MIKFPAITEGDTWWRWIAIGSGALLVCVLLGAGGWYWWSRAQEASLDAFSGAAQLYREVTTECKLDKAGDARRLLEEFLAKHSRTPAAPLAAYYLANLHYRAQAYETARAAFQQALQRGAKGDLALLSQVGIAYSWESEGQYANARRAYEGTLAQLTPTHFLYEEVGMALARMQELQKELPLALDTYRRLLKEHPGSRRADEIRSRIAVLEGVQRRQ